MVKEFLFDSFYFCCYGYDLNKDIIKKTKNYILLSYGRNGLMLQIISQVGKRKVSVAVPRVWHRAFTALPGAPLCQKSSCIAHIHLHIYTKSRETFRSH